ncbi:MAG TPA: nitroreductase family protein [Bacteroidales bacterium]|nr:nitroreductase family protein [Bacteroidales bacterium]
MNSLKNRRTVRSYSDQEIDELLLNGLLETACRSSNTGNMQAYSIVVTKDVNQKRALAPAHFNQPQVNEAPVVLTFCVDFNRIGRWCQQRNATPGFDNLQALTYASIDAIIVAQTFCVAAEEAGLGICYLGTTTYNPETIIDVLQLPSLVLPITTLSVGYPKEPATTPLPDRLPLEGIVHQETYSEFDIAAIDRIYAEKESLEESLRFLEINQKDTLAQIYTDIRYKKSDNEFFSKSWLKAIKRQGFIK